MTPLKFIRYADAKAVEHIRFFPLNVMHVAVWMNEINVREDCKPLAAGQCLFTGPKGEPVAFGDSQTLGLECGPGATQDVRRLISPANRTAS
jgi:hypothetical protein